MDCRRVSSTGGDLGFEPATGDAGSVLAVLQGHKIVVSFELEVYRRNDHGFLSDPGIHPFALARGSVNYFTSYHGFSTHNAKFDRYRI